jgi:hypothetical protein
MRSYPLNRLLVVVLALPAAILIAAAAAFLDHLFPRGSWLNFLAATLPMVLVIGGAMTGFAVACEKCEGCLSPAMDEEGGKIRAAEPRSGSHRPRFSIASHHVARLFRQVGDCGRL